MRARRIEACPRVSPGCRSVNASSDAAIAAGNHLCRAVAGPVTTVEGWRAGIAAYNAGSDYFDAVTTAAQRYHDAAG